MYSYLSVCEDIYQKKIPCFFIIFAGRKFEIFRIIHVNINNMFNININNIII